jgi:hypothetical protein
MSKPTTAAGVMHVVLTLLFLSVLSPPSAVESHERGITVTPTASGLSVSAHNVTLASVLQAIGAKAGFSVVEVARTRPVLSLGLGPAPVGDLLRQVLRGENHMIVQRADGTVAEIVLFGTAPHGRTDGTPLEPRPGTLGEHEPAPGTEPASKWTAPPWVSAREIREPRGREGGGRLSTGVGIAHLLETQALLTPDAAASLFAPSPSPIVPSLPVQFPAAEHPAPTRTHDPQEILTLTTAIARQNVRALVDALAAATRGISKSAVDTTPAAR